MQIHYAVKPAYRGGRVTLREHPVPNDFDLALRLARECYCHHNLVYLAITDHSGIRCRLIPDPTKENTQ